MAAKRTRRYLLGALALAVAVNLFVDVPYLVWWYAKPRAERTCIETTTLDLFREPGETDAEYDERWWATMDELCGAFGYR